MKLFQVFQYNLLIAALVIESDLQHSACESGGLDILYNYLNL